MNADLFTSFEAGLFWVALSTSALLLVMVILSFVGIHHDTDVSTDTDHDLQHDDSNAGFQFFTVKNLFAFLAMLSWTALNTTQNGGTEWLASIYGLLAGLGTVLVMTILFWMISKLQTDNTPSMKPIIGKIAKVHLRIPSHGQGKILVELNGSMQEFAAINNTEEDLPTGSLCKVCDLFADVPLVEKLNNQ